jgi:glycosyltransferase involved in cell wall biosynthesis
VIQKLKVGIISDVNLLEYIGGAERWIITLASELQKHNVDVTIFMPSKKYLCDHVGNVQTMALKSFYKSFGFETIAHGIPDPIMKKQLVNALKGYDVVILNNLTIMFAPCIKSSKRIGVIHDYFPVCTLRLASCLDKGMSISLGNCSHCLFKESGFKTLDLYIFKNLIKKSLNAADDVILQSESQYLNMNILDKKIFYRKPHIVGPFLDKEVEEILKSKGLPSKKDIAISYVGGLKISRGFDRFVKIALNILNSPRIPVSSIHIHGKLEERKMLSDLTRLVYQARSKGLNVHTGYIKYKELLEEFRNNLNIIITPSRCQEVAPLTVLEAFALGSVIFSLRKAYGPYEYSLKILSRVSRDLAEKYIDIAKELYMPILNKNNTDLSAKISGFIDVYADNNFYQAVSREAIKISRENLKEMLKIIFS